MRCNKTVVAMKCQYIYLFLYLDFTEYVYIYVVIGNCFVFTDDGHLNAKPLIYLYFDGFKWHTLVQQQYHSPNPPKYNPMTSKSKMIGKCGDRRF